MTAYLLRRLLYAVPILIGVNLLTFALFFVVNSPDDMARLHLGNKHVTADAIATWKRAHGYDRPLLYAPQSNGLGRFTDTLFFEKSARLLVLDFGHADDGRDIGRDIRQRMGPSLAIAVPGLILGLLTNITLALGVVFVRGSGLERAAVFLAVVGMSISTLFYIIGAQYLLAKLLNLAPVSGWQDGWGGLKFLILPLLVGVVSGIGGGLRWYRLLFLEEAGKDYIRTARAKGLSEGRVLGRHLLRNAAIPILTGVVAVIPLLFMGGLLTESFFAIPGLGSYTIDAIQSQDFSIVRAMVFLGALLYLLGLLLTDVSYTLADPRVRLQ
jgi:peptide/nickel transport system permease protein